MTSRRVLITGVSAPLASRLAAQLAADPRVEHVVGVDTRRPPEPLAGRIAFVEADLRRDGLSQILRVASPHVVVHHDVVQFPEPGRRARMLHDLNVIGTLQLVAACADVPGLQSLVVRSSAAIYGSRPDAPAFFTEDLARTNVTGPASTRFQRDVFELERLVEAFARRRPEVVCTLLRLQPVVGASLDSPLMRLLRAPIVPTFLGFDPLVQLLHDDDAVGAVAAAVHTAVRGPVNVAGEGTIALSDVLRRLGRRPLPLAAPLYGPATAALGRAGAVPHVDPDVVRYLRHGRGVDTTRMRRDLGFTPRYTTPGAVEAIARALRADAEAAA